MKNVTLYGKPGCHLCEDARDILLAAHARAPFTLREVNILDDDALFAKYAEEIPVVTIDGVFFCRYHVDADAFVQTLHAAEPNSNPVPGEFQAHAS